MKVFANERGLTLIELLVGLAITSIIAASAYGVFTAGMKAYKRIGIENQLRSEADILMTTIFNELYALAPDGLKKLAPDGLKKDESNDYTLTFVNRMKKEIDTSTGLVEEKEKADQTLQIRIDKTNETLLINGKQVTPSNLRIVPEQSEFQYKCMREQQNICKSGVVTIRLSVQDEDHRNPDDPLYIEPFTLQSQFGF
ncbi:prepilin-type N-terminal cleavage/methylation domain-containing protein [Anoxybacillus flavithermus]|uniref:prepilin-type N-terminal cleavage/methylation domain-containing protein n=1 Tax=Anoxybacillus flavithermus TaxID=33934 RepID=UPI000B4A3E13|nr:prepilin-type N-terminal cleavage/methylation domain-containing protein [Anoxybacillus flavithermus]ASA97798.1 Tfp pilus assembly protein [Anoxybacillus flavithermus]MBE2931124.1 prepilin-type N-terminal cleavage/methylation domain-containing protein [Anoxybacillus flavithermus]MBE2933991.1 prepilin-type N-terminal cleavage/methylation domain-containing protein [Anoxybacillus flavithermus]